MRLVLLVLVCGLVVPGCAKKSKGPSKKGKPDFPEATLKKLTGIMPKDLRTMYLGQRRAAFLKLYPEATKDKQPGVQELWSWYGPAAEGELGNVAIYLDGGRVSRVAAIVKTASCTYKWAEATIAELEGVFGTKPQMKKDEWGIKAQFPITDIGLPATASVAYWKDYSMPQSSPDCNHVVEVSLAQKRKWRSAQ